MTDAEFENELRARLNGQERDATLRLIRESGVVFTSARALASRDRYMLTAYRKNVLKVIGWTPDQIAKMFRARNPEWSEDYAMDIATARRFAREGKPLYLEIIKDAAAAKRLHDTLTNLPPSTF
jgi:hypothetical protein